MRHGDGNLNVSLHKVKKVIYREVEGKAQIGRLFLKDRMLCEKG
jgi:hypothetical protein